VTEFVNVVVVLTGVFAAAYLVYVVLRPERF
jgi:hypothetical protein